MPCGPEQACGLAQHRLVDHLTLETEDAGCTLGGLEDRVGPSDLRLRRQVGASHHLDLAGVDAGRGRESGGGSILGLGSLPVQVGNVEVYGVDRGLPVSTGR